MMANRDESESDDVHVWQVGDVENDMQKLRTAIQLSNADVNLAQSERLFMLDTFAKSRRPMLSDLWKFGLEPFLLTGLWIRFGTSVNPSGCVTAIANGMSRAKMVGFLHNLAKKSTKWLVMLSDVHFWTVVVATPLFYAYVQRREQFKLPVPKLKTYHLNVNDDPRKSCQNSPLCLSELMASSVCGMAGVGLVTCLCSRFLRGSLLGLPFLSESSAVVSSNHKIRSVFLLWLFAAQLINRLGIAAALHQYPKLLFQLRRSNQPRPLSKYTVRVQRLLRLILSPMAVFTACDVSKLIPLLKLLSVKELFSIVLQKPRYMGVLYAMSIPLFLPSLIHMRAFSKIISLEASLTSAQSPAIFPLVQNPKAMLRKSILRWKLRWRDPRRVSDVLQKWIHFYFTDEIPHDAHDDLTTLGDRIDFSSSVDLWKRRNHYRSDIEHDESKDEFGHWLLDQVGKDMVARAKDDSDMEPKLNRDEWKQMILDGNAARHQEDFDTRKFKDPLGVAVQQTLGVGLNFDYDHDTPLQKDETPSIYRLRARAAKSAVRRAQELYNPERAREHLSQFQNKNVSPATRNREAALLRERVVNEIESLGASLVELVPTNGGPPPEGVDIQINFARTMVKPIDRDALLFSEELLDRDSKNYGDDAEWENLKNELLDNPDEPKSNTEDKGSRDSVYDEEYDEGFDDDLMFGNNTVTYLA
eukprot:CAMPEP_0194449162 /NCGR_PEP_ID=MMETSP0176-20130528/129982_1 /TAXON_ID=216777 /ORGANISM="Proboscia alata, Strain PI-D3" /LENGTH=697 /DNA_ID=CAMNT_0039276239 /DNA_START=253 /DNA_END=2346 /DNA_ORIENTATION=-